MYELLQKQQVRIWLALAGAATLIIGGAYTMVQQSTRLAADDAPFALAQTIKNQLESGASANDTVPTQNVDMRDNSNTFAIVTDASQHTLASSVSLDGQTPLPPRGVFAYTTQHGTDHFTWEPAHGVRAATYVMSYGNSPNNGFIITGQSLAQAEKRIKIYSVLALASWLATLAWITFVLLLPEYTRRQKRLDK